MAKTKLNQTVVIALTLSFGAIPAFADNIFGTNQQYVPGNVGTNISDDTPPDPNEVKKQQRAESASTPDSLGTTQAAPAGSNAAGSTSGAVVPGVNSKAPGATDFTVDEKRMQKKYKASLGHYKELIAKGEDMMQKSPDPNSETYKKGKILKEIGEKHLAAAQTNNPFALTSLDPDGKDGTAGPKPKEKLTDKVGNFFHKEFENFKGPDAQKPPGQTAQTADNS